MLKGEVNDDFHNLVFKKKMTKNMKINASKYELPPSNRFRDILVPSSKISTYIGVARRELTVVTNFDLK